MDTWIIQTHARLDVIDITDKLIEFIAQKKWHDGILYLFVPHTSAALTINEHYDPDVAHDIHYGLANLFSDMDFKHIEGNSDAHIKTALFSTSELVFIENNKMILGKWQRILFYEFDGPRDRKIYLKFINNKGD